MVPFIVSGIPDRREYVEGADGVSSAITICLWMRALRIIVCRLTSASRFRRGFELYGAHAGGNLANIIAQWAAAHSV